MAGLQIVAFRSAARVEGAQLQVPESPPADVTVATFTGTYTVPDGCYLIKITGNGTGTITWPTDATPETFPAVEFRAVRPGQTFVVA